MSPTTEDQDKHWLVRRRSIKKLWVLFIVILTITVLVQLPVPLHGNFGIDSWPAFPAIYGFLGCVAMIFFAKMLAIFLKRKDTYYDDD